jgi:hypothetical protein
VGTPITNCQPGANADVTDAIGGSITITETWSLGATVGFNMGVLQFSANPSLSRATAIQYSQTISIVVHPNQMVCRGSSLKARDLIYDGISGCSGRKHPVSANEREYADWRRVSLNLCLTQPTAFTRLTSRQDYPVVANQPVTIVSYGPEIVPCDAQFDANVSSPFNCTSNAQTWHKGSIPSVTSLAPIIVMVLLSMSLIS